jgi:hypothetical protein
MKWIRIILCGLSLVFLFSCDIKMIDKLEEDSPEGDDKNFVITDRSRFFIHIMNPDDNDLSHNHIEMNENSDMSCYFFSPGVLQIYRLNE